MPNIEKEMKAAQHLLYVSMKYTKTCDVMLNLMYRWQMMVDEAMLAVLEKAKKKKLIKEIPVAPIQKANAVKEMFKKEKLIQDSIALYLFFRKIKSCTLSKEHEFRKNVALRVTSQDAVETLIDIEKLKEWQLLLENFIKFVRAYTA